MRRFAVCMSAATVIAAVNTVAAQSTFDAPMGEYIERLVESGDRANVAMRSAVVFSTVVHTEGALWTRLYFSDVLLDGQSRVRMTSLLDGAVQELDSDAMRMWSNSSAYFNGDSVLLELIAAPGTQNNRIAVDRLGVEMADHGMPIGTCGICGGDSRVPSDEDWAGRLAPGGCTASIYNEQSCAVSAGHCMGGNDTVLFRVPPSLPNCNTQNPPVEDQFPITGQIFQDTGVGGDWAAMTLGTNNLGQTAYERYGVYRPIASAPAPNGAPVSVWGYGTSSICTSNYIQQLSEGTINAVTGSTYRALIDVTFGNSGSALIYNGEIIGVVTHCATCGDGNIMNRIDAPAFVEAREQLCAAPLPNDTCDGAIVVGSGSFEFSSVGATTTGPDEPDMCSFDGNSNVQSDIWFSYVASCTGTVTFSLCDGDQPAPGGDCAGYCNGQAPSGCWCDNECDSFGDCCADICDDCPDLNHCLAGPCAGHCGGQSPQGCWCDDSCAGFNDCCPGVCNDCPNQSHCTAAGSSTGQLSAFDTKMAIYNSCPTGSGEVIGCNKDACGLLSSVTVSAVAGETYLIRIGGHNGATGEGTLTIECEADPTPTCPADLNGDGVVDVSDMLLLLGAWGPCTGCDEDITGDNVVGISDLLELLAQWGACS